MKTNYLGSWSDHKNTAEESVVSRKKNFRWEARNQAKSLEATQFSNGGKADWVDKKKDATNKKAKSRKIECRVHRKETAKRVSTR